MHERRWRLSVSLDPTSVKILSNRSEREFGIICRNRGRKSLRTVGFTIDIPLITNSCKRAVNTCISGAVTGLVVVVVVVVVVAVVVGIE